MPNMFANKCTTPPCRNMALHSRHHCPSFTIIVVTFAPMSVSTTADGPIIGLTDMGWNCHFSSCMQRARASTLASTIRKQNFGNGGLGSSGSCPCSSASYCAAATPPPPPPAADLPDAPPPPPLPTAAAGMGPPQRSGLALIIAICVSRLRSYRCLAVESRIERRLPPPLPPPPRAAVRAAASRHSSSSSTRCWDAALGPRRGAATAEDPRFAPPPPPPPPPPPD